MRLRALLDTDALGLRLLGGEEELDRTVRGVMTTDLRDPSRYLSGGELVLSGLAWRRDAADSEPFVRILARAGVSALAAGEAELGLVPEDLVTACARHRLPLFAVHESVAFAAITEHVVRQVSGERAGDLAAVVDRHRRMMTSGPAGGGPEVVLDLLGSDLDLRAWVLSPTGRLIAGQKTAGSALPAELCARLAAEHLTAARGGRPGPYRVVEEGVTYSLFPVRGDGGAGGRTGGGTGGAQGSAGVLGVGGVQEAGGLRGATGALGTAGAQGGAGARNAAGSQGGAGSLRATGPQGAAEPQGATGAQGTTRSQDGTGAHKATGPQGAAGPRGATGTRGAAGASGGAGSQVGAGAQGGAGSPGAWEARAAGAWPQGAAGAEGARDVRAGALSEWVLVVEADAGEWPAERLDLLGGVTQLIAVERDRRDAARAVRRRLAQEVFELVHVGAQPAEIAARLRVAAPVLVPGLGAAPNWQVVVARVEWDGDEGAARTGPLAQALLEEILAGMPGSGGEVSDRVAVAHTGDEAVALVPLPSSVSGERDGSEAGVLADALAATVREPLAAGLDGDGRLTLGVSAAVHSAEGLRGALEEARHARRVAAARPGRVCAAGHQELASHVLLLPFVPDDVRRAFTARLLDPLRAYDRRHRAELVPTLEAFLDCDGSWTRCASRLHLHVNTLRYRVGRIEQLTGRDLSRLEDKLDFFLALRMS